MTCLSIGTLVFARTFGGALAGIWLHTALPDHHLSSETKDTVKLGIGLIAMVSSASRLSLANEIPVAPFWPVPEYPREHHLYIEGESRPCVASLCNHWLQ